MPFWVEFELTSIFGWVNLPSTRHQPTYPWHRYRFFWGKNFCIPTCTPEKPVAKPAGFINLWHSLCVIAAWMFVNMRFVIRLSCCIKSCATESHLPGMVANNINPWRLLARVKLFIARRSINIAICSISGIGFPPECLVLIRSLKSTYWAGIEAAPKAVFKFPQKVCADWLAPW